MIKIRHYSLIIGFCTLSFTATINADGFIKKEVYSFKDKSGSVVFTDRLPAKKQAFTTQTIEAANSTANSQNDTMSEDSFSSAYDQRSYSSSSIPAQQTVRIVLEDNRDSFSKKKVYKKKRSLKRCKSYKKKFTYYSDRMKQGYKSSEYKKLEAKRKKFKKLLFNNCETKTFSD